MVILLAGMTAWETQEIKSMYLSAPSQEVAQRMGILGALQLYSSFVIMFIHVFEHSRHHARRIVSHLEIKTFRENVRFLLGVFFVFTFCFEKLLLNFFFD